MAKRRVVTAKQLNEIKEDTKSKIQTLLAEFDPAKQYETLTGESWPYTITTSTRIQDACTFRPTSGADCSHVDNYLRSELERILSKHVQCLEYKRACQVIPLTLDVVTSLSCVTNYFSKFGYEVKLLNADSYYVSDALPYNAITAAATFTLTKPINNDEYIVIAGAEQEYFNLFLESINFTRSIIYRGGRHTTWPALDAAFEAIKEGTRKEIEDQADIMIALVRTGLNAIVDLLIDSPCLETFSSKGIAYDVVKKERLSPAPTSRLSVHHYKDEEVITYKPTVRTSGFVLIEEESQAPIS